MRYYEILYILNPNFEKKKVQTSMKEIDKKLNEIKFKIINHHIWGKKRLAYSMDGHKYGTYILLQFENSNKNKLNEFDSWLKLSKLVIRHMIVRLNSKPEIIETLDNEINNEGIDDMKTESDSKTIKEKKISSDNKKESEGV